MLIERTRNMELVSAIVRDPAIWPHVHDDGCDADWQPIDDENLFWMLVTTDTGLIGGVFMVHPLNSYCYEMHTCLLSFMWGPEAARAAQLLAGWVFNEAGAEKLVTNVPSYNRAARRFAIAGGMQQEGINRASFMRNGVMVDQIMLGITKQEWTSCQ